MSWKKSWGNPNWGRGPARAPAARPAPAPSHGHNRLPVVAPHVAAHRFRVCQQCPKFTRTEQCRVCNCFMRAKTKLQMAPGPSGQLEVVRCPHGHWR